MALQVSEPWVVVVRLQYVVDGEEYVKTKENLRMSLGKEPHAIVFHTMDIRKRFQERSKHQYAAQDDCDNVFFYDSTISLRRHMSL